jgi:hypothetical protein
LRRYAVFLIGALGGCVYSEDAVWEEDAVGRVVRRYGVGRERVLAVVEELGVDPTEIETFGPYFFPYNYYQHQFELFEREHGRPPTRSEVEQIVKGYIAKCAEGQYGIAYVYYSKSTHGEAGEFAMVFRTSFQLPPPNGPAPEDPAFTSMQPIELWDASVNPSYDTYWENCIEEYEREH